MANIHQDNDNVYIDLWDKTLTFNSIEYALYQLNSAFELRISKDIDAILNYRINGVPYKVSTVNGRQTNDICPYSWESLEYVRQTINETRLCVDDVFTSYGISLTPNWREINKKWLAEVDRLEKIFGEALGNSAQAALNNQAQKYQQAYSEELSKDFGLSFGILSSSWTAHLLYAAQSAAKERKDHARAEHVAADVMKNSHVDITAQIFATVYPIYVDSLEPAMQKLLSEYYAYVIAIFSKELHCSYDDVTATFDFKRSNGFILGVSDDAKANILQALQAFPNNGNVVGYAINNGVLDDELCEYGKNAPENFGIILKKWAISVLSEIYTAGKLFNKPLVTDENKAIIEGLIKYFDYIEDDALGADDWQEILTEVYGDELTDVGDLFEIFDNLKESNANIIKYAQANKKLVISNEMIKKFIVACEMKDGSCSWYAINMDIDTDQPITVSQVRESIIAVNAKIDAEVAILKKKEEEHRAEEECKKAEEQKRQAELKRQQELERAKTIKKVAIVGSIIVAIVVFLVILTSVIIPNSKYNDAIALMDAGQYEDAIVAFEAMDGYKDSKQQIKNCENALKEIEYQKAEKAYSSKNYEQAYSLFYANLGYKDSLERAYESASQVGKIALERKNYDKAIEWYSKAGKYEDVKNVKYQYVLTHRNNDDQTTYSYLSDLRRANYKDSVSIYSELYTWKIEFIAVNSDPDSTENLTTISKYDPVYFHFKLTGGTPNATIKPYVQYKLPNGNGGTYEWSYYCEDGYVLWYGWENGIYGTPQYGKEGTMTITIYPGSSTYIYDPIGTISVTIGP